MAGRKGASATPRAARMGVQPPVEPNRGQLAPPSARIVARGRSRQGTPPAVLASAPAASQPVHSWRGRTVTPSAASRAPHARSRGEAFSACGNTRPLDPTKVGCPSPSTQATRAAGGKTRTIGSSQSRAVP